MRPEPQPLGTPPDTDSAPPRATPLLGIGLPVYNGAAHLRTSIESLLAQDVADLELVIVDNASTDDTAAICAEYAVSDPRVRYLRNPENIGAARNFSRAFESSRGEFFMWGSDDDVWDPAFASRCIEALRERPEAVMCTSGIEFIGQHGEAMSSHTYKSIDTRHLKVDARVHELIIRNGWFGIYSVIRPEALRATRLALPLFGMDVILQLELLLYGEALALDETLFRYRLPETNKTADDYMSELDPARVDARPVAPWTELARTLLETVRLAELEPQMVAAMERDFVDTFALENTGWAWEIFSEQGVSHDLLYDYEKARDVIGAALGLWDPPMAQRHVGHAARAARRAARFVSRRMFPGIERRRSANTERARRLASIEYEQKWLRKNVDELNTPVERD